MPAQIAFDGTVLGHSEAPESCPGAIEEQIVRAKALMSAGVSNAGWECENTRHAIDFHRHCQPFNFLALHLGPTL